MKRVFAVVLAVAMMAGLAACGAGNAGDVKITLGESGRFTRAELDAAAQCALEKFRGFEGCTMQKLWYDEARADAAADSYLRNGRGAGNGAARENVIVLHSDFTTDGSPPGGFNPNDKYTGWNWILIRDSENGAWRVDDYGY